MSSRSTKGQVLSLEDGSTTHQAPQWEAVAYISYVVFLMTLATFVNLCFSNRIEVANSCKQAGGSATTGCSQPWPPDVALSTCRNSTGTSGLSWTKDQGRRCCVLAARHSANQQSGSGAEALLARAAGAALASRPGARVLQADFCTENCTGSSRTEHTQP